jgi:hypothetical protein
MPVIRLTKISRRYQMGSETIHALREVPNSFFENRLPTR